MQIDALLPIVASLLDQTAANGDIAITEQQQRLGRQPVATGTAGFLIIAFDVFGQIVMDHKADVGLVDPHAESHGSHHQQQVVLQKSFLHPASLFIAKSCMIGGGGQSCLLKLLRHLFDPLAA